MSSDYIAQYTLTADGEVITHEGASHVASSSRSSTDVNAEVIAVDPQSSIRNVEKRLAFLDERQQPTHVGRDGQPVYALSEVQRAKFAAEAKHLREVTLPFEQANSENIVARQAAAAATQAEKLQSEADLNAEIERRAHAIAVEEAAKKLAARMARDLHV